MGCILCWLIQWPWFLSCDGSIHSIGFCFLMARFGNVGCGSFDSLDAREFYRVLTRLKVLDSMSLWLTFSILFSIRYWFVIYS